MGSKFLHLQVGQQFEYQGGHYTKVSPLIASNNSDGSQRMIPRSALVNPSVAGADPAQAAPAPERAITPQQALDAFDASRVWLLAQLAPLPPTLPTLLAEQRQRFIAALQGDTP